MAPDLLTDPQVEGSQESYQPTTRLIPLTSWPDHHPWPSVAGLRFLVQHAQRKKFLSAFRKLGGRILIDEAAFFQWAESADEKEKVHGVVAVSGGAE